MCRYVQTPSTTSVPPPTVDEKASPVLKQSKFLPFFSFVPPPTHTYACTQSSVLTSKSHEKRINPTDRRRRQQIISSFLFRFPFFFLFLLKRFTGQYLSPPIEFGRHQVGRGSFAREKHTAETDFNNIFFSTCDRRRDNGRLLTPTVFVVYYYYVQQNNFIIITHSTNGFFLFFSSRNIIIRSLLYYYTIF